jgi:hypothetical protein
MTPDPGDPRRSPVRGPSGDGSGHVARLSHRRRRLIDSVCALPLLGWILWGLPLLWIHADSPVPSSTVLIYIFGVWLGLALAAARLIWLMERVRHRDAAFEEDEA